MPRPHRWRPFIIVASYVFYAGGTGASSSCSRARSSGTRCSRCASSARADARDAQGAARRSRSSGTSACSATSSTTTSSSPRRTTSSALVGLDLPLDARSIVLPVGISFFTFMAISYVVDVYRGDFAPRRSRSSRSTSRSSRTSSPARSCGRRADPAARDAARPALRVDTRRAFFLIATGPVQEGGDRELPRRQHRRPGVRRAGPALVARDPRRGLRVRGRRSTPTSSGTRTSRSAIALLLGFTFPAELRLAVHGDVDQGLLAALAHDALALAARLPLHPARRQPRRRRSSRTAT